eukprot:922226-Lingulodinium_polyedra.AAC.1
MHELGTRIIANGTDSVPGDSPSQGMEGGASTKPPLALDATPKALAPHGTDSVPGGYPMLG